MYNGTRLVVGILLKFSEFDIMAAVIVRVDLISSALLEGQCFSTCPGYTIVFFVLISIAKFLIGK